MLKWKSGRGEQTDQQIHEELELHNCSEMLLPNSISALTVRLGQINVLWVNRDFPNHVNDWVRPFADKKERLEECEKKTYQICFLYLKRTTELLSEPTARSG